MKRKAFAPEIFDHAEFRAGQRRQRGASLLFALSALVGLSLAGVAMMRTADTSTLVAGNIGFHEAAVQSTDLALEHARSVLLAMSGNAPHSNISGSNYYASLPTPVTQQPFVGPNERLSTSLGTQVSDEGTGNTGNSMRYVIERMCSTTGWPSTTNCLMEGYAAVYRVTTLVTGPRNTSEIVQHRLVAGQFHQDCAIMTNSTMNFAGNPMIGGTNNCVFSNDSVAFGAPAAPVQVGAVMAVNFANNTGASGGSTSNITNAGGTAMPNQPPRELPPIVPSNYRQYADYIFLANGTVQQKDWVTGTYSNVPPPSWPAGFAAPGSGVGANACPANYWCRGGSASPPPGLYYFETNVKLQGSGSLNIAVIAVGSIDASGGVTYINYKKNDPTLVPASVDNIFMLAGGDISFGGSSAMGGIQGILAANEEIALFGNAQIFGSALARNSNPVDPAPIHNIVNSNNMSGNPTITYNPDPSLSLWPMDVARRQWRTVDS